MNRHLESSVRAWLVEVEATIRTLDPQQESDAVRLSAFDDQLRDRLVSSDGLVRARIWDIRHQILRRNALKSSGWQYTALDWAARACQELNRCEPVGEDFREYATGIRVRWATANLALDDIAPASRERLTAAIVAFQLALPNTAGESRAIALTNYAIALTQRRRSPWAELDDLSTAVDAAQEAVNLTDDDNPQAGSRYLNLGAALRERYADTGVIADLTSAVESAEWVIDHLAVPPHHQAMILNNIGQGRRELFEVTLDRRHLRSAIRSLRRAGTAARRWSPPVLPRTLVSLSIAVREQGGSAAAHRALAICREALALTPKESSEWAGRRGTLANCLLEASRASSDEQASRLALEARDAVADACNGDSPAMVATWLSSRADINVRLFELTTDPAHRAAAIADLEASLGSTLAGSPLIGLGVAAKLAQLNLDIDDLSAAETALRRGCQLLSDLLPRQWLRQDQRDWHRHAAELTGLYAVVAIRLGRPVEDVIDMIETYRGIEELAIAGALRAADSGLEGTIRLSTRNWLRGEPASPDLHDQIERRLSKTRPMREDSGSAHAYVIESAVGGVFLSWTADEGCRAVLLPQLTSRRVRSRLRVFDQAYRRRDVDRGRWEAEARAIGRWITRNILAPADSVLPDLPVTLVPCGRLSALPWSTARSDPRLRHLGWSERPTTLRTSAGRPMTSTPLDSKGAVVIAADTTRAVEFEAAVVSRLCSPRVLAEATVPDALLAMADADFVYIAAHGDSCDEDAARSAILLQTGRLTAADIAEAQMPRAPIVFLASCDTGRPDAALPDQTFGLIHALLLAGASAVVAPTYAVSRLGALLTAMAFCDALKTGPHPTDPAEAFRQAMTTLAQTTNREKTAWVRQYLPPDDNSPDDLCSWLESWPAEGMQLASATGWGMFALHR